MDQNTFLLNAFITMRNGKENFIFISEKGNGDTHLDSIATKRIPRILHFICEKIVLKIKNQSGNYFIYYEHIFLIP